MDLKKLTKAELMNDLRRALAEIEALRTEVSGLREDAKRRASRAESSARVVGEYTRADGVRMAKVQIGYNTYAHRPVQ